MATSDFALLTVENTGGVLALKRKGAAEVVPESASPVIGTAAGNAAVFPDAAGERVLRSVKVTVEPVQEGSVDSGPSNVRPISGWVGAKVTRRGKNLFNPDSTDRYWVNLNGTVTTPVTTKSCTLSVSAGTTLTLSNAAASSSSNILLLAFFSKSNTLLSRNVMNSGNTYLTAAAPNDTAYVIASFYVWELAEDAQLELGSAATAYEPCYDNTLDVTFPTEAGTVCGGVLDLTAGTLTVDTAYVELGDYTSISGYGSGTGVLIQGVMPTSELQASGICSHGRVAKNTNPGTIWVGAGNNIIYWNGILSVLGLSTVDEFKTWLSTQRVQLVYKFGNPNDIRVYHLTPAQIAALAGLNTVFADCGPVEVEWVRDTETVINAGDADTRAMIAELSGETASRSLAVGEYVTAGDKLYRVTSAVGAGETLVPGSNVTQTTVGAELSRLAAMISQ